MTGARGLAAGDWDDDGDSDLAVANFSNATVVIMKNDGSGDFGASSYSWFAVWCKCSWSLWILMGMETLTWPWPTDGGSTVGILEKWW